MSNFFAFLYKYRNALLFLLLQFFSFWMLFNTNEYHETSFMNSSQAFFGTFYEKKNDLQQYFHLKKENKRLTKENAEMHEKSIKSFYKLERNIFKIKDTLYKQTYFYLPAKVINSTIQKQRNFITINRGSKNGVKPEMGVISPKGIVGIVKDVSKHYATILPVLNPNFYTSVKLKKSNNFGMLNWKGRNIREATMSDVPQYVDVKKGDTIVTRGAAGLYPENVNVGVVSKVITKKGKNFHKIRVNLSTDFNGLYRVYAISNVLKHEKDSLEEKTVHNAE
ncbi:MAG: rod shape-determining protein MreC [Flavobacteriales bacterium]